MPFRRTAALATAAALTEMRSAQVSSRAPLAAPADVAELGAATAIEFHRHGRLTAAAEPARRGGGAAAVVHPR